MNFKQKINKIFNINNYYKILEMLNINSYLFLPHENNFYIRLIKIDDFLIRYYPSKILMGIGTSGKITINELTNFAIKNNLLITIHRGSNIIFELKHLKDKRIISNFIDEVSFTHIEAQKIYENNKEYFCKYYNTKMKKILEMTPLIGCEYNKQNEQLIKFEHYSM